MRCIHCGFENAPAQRFCGNCGVGLATVIACTACGTSNPPGQNFCGQCGTDLRAPDLRAPDLRAPDLRAPDLRAPDLRAPDLRAPDLRAPGRGAGPQPDAPERRYLTVMFCDLVGSTAMSEELDPEDLGDLILTYREIVAAAVARFEGYVARYVGDGILIYFGYPRAHGDDPSRAVHAAHEAIAAMSGMKQTPAERETEVLVARIGIHTGLAVVGDLARGAVREEAAVVGETPNLAARLTELAGKNAILISGVTHALVRNDFDCRALGSRRLKGLSRPVDVHQVIGPRAAGTKVIHAMNATPLTGRDRELSFLRDRWRQAVAGAGQVVSIVGEPGIGKSRLVRAFADSVPDAGHLPMVLYCSPHFSNSALYPVVDYLNRWLDDAADGKLARLADAISAVNMDAEKVVPIIASLLSLPLAAPYQAPQLSARGQRDLTMEFLVQWLIRQAVGRPTLLVIEDLHWADASSLELVRLLLDQIHSARFVLLMTFRPDFHPPWPLHSYVSHLPLDRLTNEEVQEMIDHVTGGLRLPDPVRGLLAAKTDGVPLFVEELTKAFIELDVLIDDDASQQTGAAIELDIPMSLHATLMARLDSMNSAKLVAQRAAVIGREFSHELIAAITTMPDGELDLGLAQLVAAELLYQRGLPPRAKYIFKHSLIQETAYRSLLRTSRLRYHRQIAEVMVDQFANVAETQPELVAYHLSAGQLPVEAAGYWRKAGERALARSANVEALAHINRSLAELALCAKSPGRIKEEVLLLIALGAALMATKGYASPEVEQTYTRARELCRELDDPSHLFPVLRGMHTYYLVHGPLRVASEMVEQLRAMAEQSANSLQRVEAHRRLGWCLFCMGQIEDGHRFLTRALDEYDRAMSPQHIVIYGSDAGVIGHVNLAWLEWFAGRTDSAMRHSRAAIDLARELSHGLSLAYALGMSAALHQCLGDAATTASLAGETIGLAEKQGFPYWVAWETALLGWARATQGHVAPGNEMLNEGLKAYKETGAELFTPYILGMLAQVYLHARNFDEALACCDRGLESSEITDAHFVDAELHRLKGECLAARGGDSTAAEASFERAVAVARAQGARMLELRALVALADLRLRNGDGGPARARLGEALEWFGPEAGSADVVAARHLLARHAGP